MEDLGLKLELEKDEEDADVQIVDVSEQICSGSGRTMVKKEIHNGTESDDPRDELEAGFSGGARSRSMTGLSKLDDHPAAIEYDPERNVCAHGKISLSDMENGCWKAVKIGGALKLFESLDIDIRGIFTETDLCPECIDDKVCEDKFMKDLNENYSYLTAELKNFPVGTSQDNIEIWMRKHYFWVSKSGLSSFRKLAIQRQKEQSVVDGSEHGEMKHSLDSTSTSGESCPELNAELLCEHGGLTLDTKLRRLVSRRVWDVLKKYFPDAVEFSAKTDECRTCLDQKVVEENDSADESATPSLSTYLTPTFPFGIRRSSRRIKPRNCQDYEVNSSDTLQELKLKIMEEDGAVPNDQHLSFEGKELTELNKTLFEYKIPDSAILEMKVDAILPEEEVLAQAEVERVRSPERGFQGSVLSQK